MDAVHRTPSPIAAGRVGPLAVARRSGLDESLHLGVAVALDADGEVVASVGDIEIDVYPRSALKPFQSAAMVGLGLELDPPLLALSAASHSGEQRHLDGVRDILARHGLTVDALRNTPTLPLSDDARNAAIAAGVAPSSLQQNCSGKHAAMLATCVINGWSTDDYLDPDHPLQRAIVESITALGAPVAHVGVDGCGAPTHVLRLLDAARALGRLARDASPVTTAMSAHPLMTSGEGRDLARWMAAVPGLVGKEGAQGVMVWALPDGRCAALKVADGNDDARRVAAVEALRHLGVDVDGEYAAVRDAVRVPVLGHGGDVGEMRPVAWVAPGGAARRPR